MQQSEIFTIALQTLRKSQLMAWRGLFTCHAGFHTADATGIVTDFLFKSEYGSVLWGVHSHRLSPISPWCSQHAQAATIQFFIWCLQQDTVLGLLTLWLINPGFLFFMWIGFVVCHVCCVVLCCFALCCCFGLLFCTMCVCVVHIAQCFVFCYVCVCVLSLALLFFRLFCHTLQLCWRNARFWQDAIPADLAWRKFC